MKTSFHGEFHCIDAKVVNEAKGGRALLLWCTPVNTAFVETLESAEILLYL